MKRKPANVIRFKSCPRCHGGDLALCRDIHGTYTRCVQCGFNDNEPAIPPNVISIARQLSLISS